MDRFKLTKRVGIIGIIGNVFLIIIKGIAGFTFKSQALIADAANSAGDIFASLMTSIGNKIASAPSDESHNLGHGKAEYIFSMFISFSMMAIAWKIFYDSIVTMIVGSKLIFSWSMIVVCLVTIIVKIGLYLYTKNMYKKCKNILIESNMKDHFNDCIVSTFTSISILLTLFGVYWVDSVVGIGISIWIFITGMKIFVESFNVLMDKSIDDETKDKIYEYIYKYKEILKIEEMYTIPTGYKYIVGFTIGLDGSLDTFESHKIADKLQTEIETNFELIDRVMIHVDPVEKDS